MHVQQHSHGYWTALVIGLLIPLACLATIPKTGDVTYWTNPTYIAVDSNRIFVSCYLKGIGMFDLSNPTQPQEALVLPWETFGGMECGLAVAGNRLYTGTRNGSFGIYNISVPAQPALLSEVPIPGGVNDVFLHDTMAVVDDYSGYLHLIGVTNPLAPVDHNNSFEPGLPLGFVDGYFCAIDENFGFRIWNISNPGFPVVAATVPFPTGEFWDGGVVNGHLACCRRIDSEGTDLGASLIDLTNPLAPVLRGATSDYNVRYMGMAVMDSVLYVSLLPGSGIHMWDIHDLDNPVSSTTFAPGRHFGALFPCGGRLGAGTYLAPHILGLYDVTNPTAPALLRGFGTQATLTAIKARDQYVFASDFYGGLHVIDALDPERPSEICLVDSVEQGFDLALEGNYAYVAGGWDGLQIINISVPDHPVREGRVELAGYNASYVAVAGTYAYVLSTPNNGGGFRLYTVNLVTPASPVVIDTLELSADITGMARSDAYLYLSSASSGYMISLAVPGHPSLYADNLQFLHGSHLCIAGSLAYLSNGYAGWSIISLANPASPSVVYTTGAATGRSAHSFVGQGNVIYVNSQIADIWRFQMQAFDVSNPAHPALIDETPMSEVPTGPMGIVGDYCYTGCNSGFSIYDCSDIIPDPDAVTPGATPLPTKLALAGCYPNPFNPRTTVAYDVPNTSRVRLAVYDITGREVATLANGTQAAGRYSVQFDGTALPTGTYFCRLTAGGQSQIQKLLLLK